MTTLENGSTESLPQSVHDIPTARPGETIPTSPDIADAIASSLQSRRRQSLPSILRSYAHNRRSSLTQPTILEEEGAEGDSDDEAHLAETEDIRRAMRLAAREYEEYKAGFTGDIKLVSGWRLDPETAREIDPEQVGEEIAPEFVWDSESA